MPVLAQCSCGFSRQLDDRYAGRKAKCPRCGTVINVPPLAGAQAKPAAPMASPAAPDRGVGEESLSADRAKARRLIDAAESQGPEPEYKTHAQAARAQLTPVTHAMHIAALAGHILLALMNVVLVLLVANMILGSRAPRGANVVGGVMLLVGAGCILVNITMLVLATQWNNFAVGSLWGATVYGVIGSVVGIMRIARLDFCPTLLLTPKRGPEFSPDLPVYVIGGIVIAFAVSYFLLMLHPRTLAALRKGRTVWLVVGFCVGLVLPHFMSPVGMSARIVSQAGTEVQAALDSPAGKAQLAARNSQLATEDWKQSEANLSSLGGALDAYAKAHGDKLPPDLDALVREGLIEQEALLSPSIVRAMGPEHEKARYRYFGKDQTRSNLAPRYVLAAEWALPERRGRRLRVLTADGRVTEAGDQDLERWIKDSAIIQTTHLRHGNMERIAEAAVAYAASHDGRLPQDLNALVTSGAIDYQMLQRPPLPNGRSAGGEYRYFGGGHRLEDFPDGALLLAGPAAKSDFGGIPGVTEGILMGDRTTVAMVSEDAVQENIKSFPILAMVHRCKANQMRLAEAIAAYAKSHEGLRPPDLETLVAEGLVKQECLYCPARLEQLGPDARDLSPAKYVYIGAGLPQESYGGMQVADSSAENHPTHNRLTLQNAYEDRLPGSDIVRRSITSELVNFRHDQILALTPQGKCEWVSARQIEAAIAEPHRVRLRTECEANLTRIFEALKAHAAKHNGLLPADLDTLVTEGLLTEETIFCPAKLHALGPDASDKSGALYDYTATAMPIDQLTDSMVLVVGRAPGVHHRDMSGQHPELFYLTGAGKVHSFAPSLSSRGGVEGGIRQTKLAAWKGRLERIGAALKTYADGHEGRLPDSLDALREAGLVTADDLLCPSRFIRDTKRKNDEIDAASRKEAPWDFHAPGLVFGNIDAALPVVTAPAAHRDVRHGKADCLMGNGSIQSLRSSQIEGAIGRIRALSQPDATEGN